MPVSRRARPGGTPQQYNPGAEGTHGHSGWPDGSCTTDRLRVLFPSPQDAPNPAESMLGTAWLTLRQAQEALKNGRLEEAQRLLHQSGAQGHQRSWDLLRQLAQGFTDRGRGHIFQDDVESAWQDLLRAEQVGMNDTGATQLRLELTRRSLADVRARLEAGDPVRAAESVALLRERLVRQPELQTMEETAKDWTKARELADRGEFAAAEQLIQQLRTAGLKIAALDVFGEDLAKRRIALTERLVQLHEAVAGGNWREVIQLADQALAVAPQHAEARNARARAWKVADPPTVHQDRPARDTTAPAAEAASRFLLWIDGIGGYLICLAPRVTLGQAMPEATVDIPLFADVSRHHATLTRDAEGYLLEAVRPMQVNGQPVEKALLGANDRVTLGSSCQIQFRQPVPVSATARLDLVSGHRLALAVDAVLLMAETLVIGPGTQAHITLPELRQPVVLFRQKAGLGIRHAGNFSVDNQRCQERGTLQQRSMVRGEDFTFAVEPVGTGLGRT